MNIINNFLIKIDEIFLQKKLPEKIAVAVSGGADSLALTLLLAEFCKKKNIELLAVTIDHKMRQSSSDEALKLGVILKKRKIFHQILKVNSKNIPQSNIEAKLREARYELLYEFCIKNKIEFLFLGHQLEDVAENFLIRLFRGSGLDGLSAIAEVSDFKKIKLVRPFLDFEKDELKKFLKSKKVEWFEDESNLDEKFLRNKIRNFLATFEDKSLIQERIKNAADEIAITRDLFNDLMLREASKILEFDQSGFFLLDLEKFKKTESKIALKILALVAMEVARKNYKPRLKELKVFYEYLLENKKIKPRNFYGCTAKQYDAKRVIIECQKEEQNFYFRTVLAKIFKPS
ncbi:MAG: tRNA lysidine(34) synthetase TilS [Pseudomonadota bacterium]